MTISDSLFFAIVSSYLSTGVILLALIAHTIFSYLKNKKILEELDKIRRKEIE